jgi:hypothetical protein
MAVWWVDVWCHVFLALAQDWVEWSASCSRIEMVFITRLREERMMDMFVLIQCEVLISNLLCKSSFLYECEMFSLALRDGRTSKLEAFETKWFRKINEPRKYKVIERFMIVHNEVFRDCYRSLGISRYWNIGHKEAVSCKRRNAWKIWWGNTVEGVHLQYPEWCGRVTLK